jgi:DNA polymerase II small subunit
LKSSNDRNKLDVLKRFINSGINLTPSTLEFILSLDNPVEKAKLIISKTSFMPEFKSHLTPSHLKKISDEEIIKALKRFEFKNIDYPTDSDWDENDECKELSDKTGEERISEAKDAHKKEDKIENKKKKELRSPKKKVKPKDTEKELIEKAETSQSSSQISESNLSGISVKSSKSTKKKTVNLSGNTLSSTSFNPIAKEYEPNFKILKDPTGKLFTSGDYMDFYELTMDKFNKLEKLMKKRPEANSSTKINNILRSSKNIEISTYGLVEKIYQTKNNHYFLTLEDTSGMVNVLVRNDPDNRENLNTAKRILEDQMVYVNGTYNPGENNRSGIIFADRINRIDIPSNFQPAYSPDPVSLVMISDTHIGSREFEEDLWDRFISFLNGNIGNKNSRKIAGRIKYLVINGDLVDGIGVYPNQETDLVINDIYKQYEKAAELISRIPDYIKVIYSPGNHEPVRNAIPRPAIEKNYVNDLINVGVQCIGNPALIETHGIKTLVYHGDSLLDLNLLVSGLENDKPVDTMKELLVCRHLAPVFGKKTQIAPTNTDWLVIDTIPHILHTGHLHINGLGKYRGVSLVNSGCFQSQTDFMRSFGINPTPGIVPVLDLDTNEAREIDLKKQS